jgi:hypothetical protein
MKLFIAYIPCTTITT